MKFTAFQQQCIQTCFCNCAKKNIYIFHKSFIEFFKVHPLVSPILTKNLDGIHQQTMTGSSGTSIGVGSVNLSSPESAYSTGYSTDGTSPGASFPPEYYINIRTGKHYFQNRKNTPRGKKNCDVNCLPIKGRVHQDKGENSSANQSINKPRNSHGNTFNKVCINNY